MPDAAFQRFMLLAEIAALMHDIGKLSKSFVSAGLAGDGDFDHCISFSTGLQGGLAQWLFDEPIPQDLRIDTTRPPLKRLGHLLKWHHYKGKAPDIFKEYPEAGDKIALLPELLLLMMLADSTDSSTSKGGAAFRSGKKRSPRYNDSLTIQHGKGTLATPFGTMERGDLLDDIDARADTFQQELADKLTGFTDWDLATLIQRRAEILELFRERLSGELAETRLPNNDVSLYQHSRSTSSIFKAMLAGHALAGEPVELENKELALHREALAFLSVRWDTDILLSRSFRAKDILGLRTRLHDAAEEITRYVERELCIGNRYYDDADGVVFLVPAVECFGKLQPAIKKYYDDFADKVEEVLNRHEGLAGHLSFRVLARDIGLKVLDLPKALQTEDGTRLLRQGPRIPDWIKRWNNSGRQEICPRCGLEPVSAQAGSAGSEADRDRMCCWCEGIQQTAAKVRAAKARWLTGLDSSPIFARYDIDDLMGSPEDKAPDNRLDDPSKDNKPDNRLALIQGVLDLRTVMDGSAFSSLLAARPEWFRNDPKQDDRSHSMQTWEEMLQAAETACAAVLEDRAGENDAHVHTLQQLFHDSFFGTEKDGRVPNGTGLEKAKGVLLQILALPFPDTVQSKGAKLVSYALRRHPSPSRLLRVWEASREFMAQGFSYCETKEIRYAPLLLANDRFLLLVKARDAWNILLQVQQEYAHRLGKVRHLLPLHLSASVFYRKAPLYVAMDAAKRFRDLALKTSTKAVPWTLQSREESAESHVLRWRTHQGREVCWNVPGTMEGVQTKQGETARDDFTLWYWPAQHQSHPVYISELAPGQQYLVHPSTFDYEVLDASTRRYDIRFERDTPGTRPHYIVRDTGPRPYPLEVLSTWSDLDRLKQVESHQRKSLQSQLCWLHQGWGGEKYRNDLAAQAQDAVRLALHKAIPKDDEEKTLGILGSMAKDGSLLDLFEWQDFIRKTDNDSNGQRSKA